MQCKLSAYFQHVCSWLRCVLDNLSDCSCNFTCDRFHTLSNLLVADQLPLAECWSFPLSWWLQPDPSCYIIGECISIVFRPVYSGPATCGTASLRPHPCVCSDCIGHSASYCLTWAWSPIVAGYRHYVWNWCPVPYSPAHCSPKPSVTSLFHFCSVLIVPVPRCSAFNVHGWHGRTTLKYDSHSLPRLLKKPVLEYCGWSRKQLIWNDLFCYMFYKWSV